MDGLALILDIAPFVAFVALRGRGLDQALGAALALGALNLGAHWLQGRPEWQAWAFGAGFGLMVVLAAASRLTGEALWFKLQPTALGLLLGTLALAWPSLWPDSHAAALDAAAGATLAELGASGAPVANWGPADMRHLLENVLRWSGVGMLAYSMALAAAARLGPDALWLLMRVVGVFAVTLFGLTLGMITL